MSFARTEDKRLSLRRDGSGVQGSDRMSATYVTGSALGATELTGPPKRPGPLRELNAPGMSLLAMGRT
jgi:hypothetical protein